MFKFYITTVIIWFIILIAQSIAFYPQFKESQKKIRKETNAEEEKWGYLRTTLWYFLICFIPIIRLIVFIGKNVMIFNTDKVIETIKEKENKDGK